MTLTFRIFREDRGSVMNVALLVLLMLSLIVIYLSRTTTTDVKIATNLKNERINFYKAESGVDIASEILEQSFACPTGFTATTPVPVATPPVVDQTIISDIVTNRLVWQNPAHPGDPSDTNYDAYYPLDYATGNKPHTTMTFGGEQLTAPGTALQMAAGYEGKGKSAAGGGVYYLFEVYSRYIDSNNSEAMIWIRWRHLVGMEDSCKY